MPNPYFKFKQFTVWHDKCAMKTGTDGTLLGAWANVDACRSILDIGTGTGLIALMLAQRNNNAQIDGIDIDSNACLQASENVSTSPFAKQIQIYCASFQDFAKESDRQYDLIISNPPYFSQSLRCPDPQRHLARHNDKLSYTDLIQFSRPLLSSGGRIALILPFQQKKHIMELAETHQLYCIRHTTVYPAAHIPPKRLLIEFSCLFPSVCEATNLILKDNLHKNTQAYQNLTRAFYL